MNMRIETGISSKCMNCNGDNDIKTIEVTLANGFIVKPMTLCKDCRRELMELLTTEFETENEVTEKSIAENDPDPIHVGARVYVADFEHKNRCPYGTITRCLSEEESKAACYLGRLVGIAFDDGLTNELTHGYKVIDDTKSLTMDPIIIGESKMNNFEPPIHGFLGTIHASNDVFPNSKLQVHTVYVDYATNDVTGTMRELMKELNKLGFDKVTLNEIKKESVHIDHAIQIIPDEVYNMLPDFLKKASLDGFLVTIKVDIETPLSFDKLMTTLEQNEPDVFYSEIDSKDEAEKAINNMVIGSAGTGKSVKQKLDAVEDFLKVIENVKEFPTFQDFCNELRKIESLEARNLAKLIQTCCKDVLGKQSDEEERINVCSSYNESDGKCRDTGKHCDGCASHYEIQNQKELLETGKGILSRMPGIGIIGISKVTGYPARGCKHCGSEFDIDDFAFAMETGLCQCCHKSLYEFDSESLEGAKRKIINKMQSRGYELKKDYDERVKRFDCGKHYLLFEDSNSCFPHLVEVNVETEKYEIIKDSLHKFISTSIFDENEYRIELSKVLSECLHPTL